jgi:hypothetical protein
MVVSVAGLEGHKEILRSAGFPRWSNSLSGTYQRMEEVIRSALDAATSTDGSSEGAPGGAAA